MFTRQLPGCRLPTRRALRSKPEIPDPESLEESQSPPALHENHTIAVTPWALDSLDALPSAPLLRVRASLAQLACQNLHVLTVKARKIGRAPPESCKERDLEDVIRTALQGHVAYQSTGWFSEAPPPSSMIVATTDLTSTPNETSTIIINNTTFTIVIFSLILIPIMNTGDMLNTACHSVEPGVFRAEGAADAPNASVPGRFLHHLRS